MHQRHWGLSESPFQNAHSQFFHESPTHGEATARLHYLIENGRRLGLLLGESGSGKSLLLERFADELAKRCWHVAQLNLVGINEDEFFGSLADGLGCRSIPGESRFITWRRITDRLAENRIQRLPTALLLDEAGEASPEVLQQVLRLLQATSARQDLVTVVLASTPKSVSRLGSRLLELVELRIELETWNEEETTRFVHESVERAGGRENIFDASAATRLHQLTRGVPRRVAQLAELALLAGAGQDLVQIDGQTVDTVYRELSAATGAR